MYAALEDFFMRYHRTLLLSRKDFSSIRGVRARHQLEIMGDVRLQALHSMQEISLSRGLALDGLEKLRAAEAAIRDETSACLSRLRRVYISEAEVRASSTDPDVPGAAGDAASRANFLH